MTESTVAGAENKNSSPEENKTAEYGGGRIEYSVLSAHTENRNPILIVPGFTGGQIALRVFAGSLNQLAGSEVILPDQPVLDKYLNEKIPIIDHQATALLKIIEQEGLTNRPLDLITHSMGSKIAFRLAELAKARSYHCFDSDEGSHSAFIAPAGSNDHENLIFLGGRWLKFLYRSMPYGKELDPTGKMMKAGVHNFMAQPKKTLQEVIELSKKDNVYQNLGNTGLKPHVFLYAGDDLYPYKTIKKAVDTVDSAAGFSMPIDNGATGARSFEEFKSRTGLSGKQAKKEWAHHYRNAAHNDLQFHPERIVKAILEVWDGNQSIRRV
jgi:pimeloyl-ACP methyl ester carboxylesterase